MAAKPQKKSALSVGSANVEEEDDEAIGAAFLGISRKIVKTAHEPKPPKDYVDSSKDLVASADAQNKEKKAPQQVFRHGPSITVKSSKDDDKKEAPKSDDKNKKKNDDTK